MGALLTLSLTMGAPGNPRCRHHRLGMGNLATKFKQVVVHTLEIHERGYVHQERMSLWPARQHTSPVEHMGHQVLSSAMCPKVMSAPNADGLQSMHASLKGCRELS